MNLIQVVIYANHRIYSMDKPKITSNSSLFSVLTKNEYLLSDHKDNI